MSMTPTRFLNLKNSLRDELIRDFGVQFNIISMTPVYGGDINQSYKLETTEGDFFIKMNDADVYPGLFEKEANGLKAIQKTGTIRVPEVIRHGQMEDTAFLLLEFINEGNKKPGFWETFGHQLAEMHRHTNTFYGWEEDNYIGSLIQFNTPDESWINFYIEQRLKPQIKMAANNGLFNLDTLERFELLFDRLYEILPDEFPHLLHGDMWNGNFLVNQQGNPVLIDPAVYYGNREVDLAMTKLFGGFDDWFYQAYHEAFPLIPGWEERIPVYQLYPLLVHVNLFGASYVPSVINILDRFV